MGVGSKAESSEIEGKAVELLTTPASEHSAVDASEESPGGIRGRCIQVIFALATTGPSQGSRRSRSDIRDDAPGNARPSSRR